jgi:transposase InsO family protein
MDFHMIWQVAACFADPIVSSHRSNSPYTGTEYCETHILTLKKETTRPPGMNILQQQATFDDFVQEFNHERPHEALAMKCPADLYVPAPVSRPARTRISAA